MNPKNVSVVLTMLVMLLLLIAWLAGSFDEKIAPEVLPIRDAELDSETVLVQNVKRKRREKVAGTITAKQTTLISSRILAPIDRIAVRAGDEVKTGDLLVSLDQRALVARRKQAEQALSGLEARMQEVQEAFSRIDRLFQQRMVSRAELDRVTAARGELSAELQCAEQVIEETDAAVSYTRITAPIPGRVIDRFLDEGDTVAPGQKIISLYDPGAMRVEANVRETLAVTLRVGDVLNVHIDALDLAVAVVLEELVPSADPGARTFLVKAALPHGIDIYPGMYAELSIEAEEVEELVIPTDSIHNVGQLDFVWMVSDGERVRRFVRRGAKVSVDNTVIISGLDAGDRILLN
jgi:RND family efflux transporter MFP subunit